MKKEIDVIATTVSGSISDWAKVERIRPLFEERGFPGTRLHVAKSHGEARTIARDLLRDDNRRLLISAGGSGTFNAVLEGCCDSGVPLGEIDLGFLRKGSADLLGGPSLLKRLEHRLGCVAGAGNDLLHPSVGHRPVMPGHIDVEDESRLPL